MRYVLIRIVSNGGCSKITFTEALEAEIRRVFGEVGFAVLNLRVIDFESEPCQAIVRCSTSGVTNLKFVLSTIRNIGEQPCVLFSERTSGTLRSLRTRRVAG
ncbi:MAG: Rpp14/Pop5 family protein [archaeon]